MNPFEAPVSKYTQQEQLKFQEFFNQIQTNNSISIPVLIEFLKKTALSQQQLSQIWTIAEVKEPITKDDFYVVLKLISAAQSGFAITKEALSMETRLPLVLGEPIQIQRTGTVASPIPIQRTGTVASPSRTAPLQPIPIQRTGQPTIQPEMTMTTEEKQRFAQFFYQLTPTNGFITAQQAREVFVKSNLENQVLAQIWNLVDKGLGKLGLNEFILAMVLITRLKQGLLISVPAVVPMGLWNFITSISTPTAQTTLPSAIPTAIPTPLTNPDKLQYYGFFDSLDTTKKGLLAGQQCLEFFLKSGLGREELAKVWDTVDVAKRGAIDKEGFANAMILIKQKLSQPAPEVNLLGDVIEDASPSIPAAIPAPNRSATLLNPSMSGILSPTMSSGLPTMGSTSPMSLQRKPSADPFKDTIDKKPIAPLQYQNIPNGLQGLETKPVFGVNPLPTAELKPNGIPPLQYQLSLPSGMQANPQTSLEVSDLAQRNQALAQKKQELAQFEKELMDLTPSLEEIQKKREEVDKEYKQVSDLRNEVMIKVSQIRAQYEAELMVVRDIQETLARESRLVQSAELELAQVQEAVNAFMKEKKRLEEEKVKQHDTLVTVKKQIADVTEETNKMREEIGELSGQVKQTQTFVDVNMKLVQSTKEEYLNVKNMLEHETKKLEEDKKRVVQLEQQKSVQEAITKREREKMEQLEKERLREQSKSQELLHVIEQGMPIEQVPVVVSQEEQVKVSQEVKLSQEVSQEVKVVDEMDRLELPTTAPPPIPSTLTKPTRSSENLTKEKENNNPIDKPPVDFDAFFATPMAAPKQTKIEQPIVDDFKFDTSFQPVVSASSTIPKATSFGDFTDSFKFDASPANGFGDLDAAFGGAPKSTEPASNPFGNVDFDAAFSTPFPAPVPSNPVSTTSATSAPMSPPTATPKTSSSQGDSPEVQNIIGMGFSREQAINALEIHSFDVNKAINYLLESVAK